MEIKIVDFQLGTHHTSEEKMAELAPTCFALNERVPGVDGEAFDLNGWYRNWRLQQLTRREGPAENELQDPTHLKVEAVDEFQAVIPWPQLGKAALLVRVNGAPIDKGFPLRLYVPDGSSKCLNVKSIIKFSFISGSLEEWGNEAVFGFKNQLKAEDLRKKVTH